MCQWVCQQVKSGCATGCVSVCDEEAGMSVVFVGETWVCQ